MFQSLLPDDIARHQADRSLLEYLLGFREDAGHSYPATSVSAELYGIAINPA